jgi:hypothetical protein
MMTKKIPAELRFDETTGQYSLHEGKSEELCKGGKPHVWRPDTEICSVCGITKLEYTLRYGP